MERLYVCAHGGITSQEPIKKRIKNKSRGKYIMEKSPGCSTERRRGKK